MMRILIFWLLSLTAVSVVGGQGKFSADVFILMGIFWTAPAVLFLTLAYFAETLLIKSRLSLVALPLDPSWESFLLYSSGMSVSGSARFV